MLYKELKTFPFLCHQITEVLDLGNGIIWVDLVVFSQLPKKTQRIISLWTWYFVMAAYDDLKDIKAHEPLCKILLKWKLMCSLFWELFHSWLQLDEIHLQGWDSFARRNFIYIVFYFIKQKIEKQPAIADAKEHKRKITTHCVSKCIWT